MRILKRKTYEKRSMGEIFWCQVEPVLMLHYHEIHLCVNAIRFADTGEFVQPCSQAGI